MSKQKRAATRQAPPAAKGIVSHQLGRDRGYLRGGPASTPSTAPNISHENVPFEIETGEPDNGRWRSIYSRTPAEQRPDPHCCRWSDQRPESADGFSRWWVTMVGPPAFRRGRAGTPPTSLPRTPYGEMATEGDAYTHPGRAAALAAQAGGGRLAGYRLCRCERRLPEVRRSWTRLSTNADSARPPTR